MVELEAQSLSQTDGRLFNAEFGLVAVASLPSNPNLSERVDAFVAWFGRLQDTLGAALLPRLLEWSLESVGTVLDNLNRAERLGWIRSASDWAELRLLRNRMVPEYVREPQHLVDALYAAHGGVADLLSAAQAMSARARSLLATRYAPSTASSLPLNMRRKSPFGQLLQQGMQARNQGRFADAQTAYQHVLKHQLEQPDALFLLGELAQAQGQMLLRILGDHTRRIWGGE